MRLLKVAPTVEEYCQDMEILLNNAGTHFYIDTSFLFWLSNLGGDARREFFDWVDVIGIERFHVPLWASHEFHQHLMDASVEKQFNEPIQRLNDAINEFYDVAMPALIEAEEMPRWPRGNVKFLARKAATDLISCSNVVDSWAKATWHQRVSDVIDFVNQRCLRSGAAFEELETIGEITENRYTGRVPPGFEDRGKKSTPEKGGNRSGDLIFWREILNHSAKANRFFKRKIKAIVVLTNDRKNDWVNGGKPPKSTGTIVEIKGLQDDWSKVSIIHPMLEHEAKVSAKVDRTAIISSFALGALFLTTGRAPTIVEATVMTKMLKRGGKIPIFEKAEKKERTLESREPKGPAANEGAEVKPKEASATDSIVTYFQILEEWTKFDEDKNQAAICAVDKLLSIHEIETSVLDWVEAELRKLAPADILGSSVILTRRALAGEAIAQDRVGDLLRELLDVSMGVAQFLYAGILFGTYCNQEKIPRAVPNKPFVQLIFSQQTASFAAVGIKALEKLVDDAGSDRPAYIPSTIAQPIHAEIANRNHNKKSWLDGIVIGDTNYMIPVEEGSQQSLPILLGIGDKEDVVATAQEIIFVCARELGFPVEQIRIGDDPERKVYVAKTNGLNIPMYEEDKND